MRFSELHWSWFGVVDNFRLGSTQNAATSLWMVDRYDAFQETIDIQKKEAGKAAFGQLRFVVRDFHVGRVH
jgi:hypothetical protein